MSLPKSKFIDGSTEGVEEYLKELQPLKEAALDAEEQLSDFDIEELERAAYRREHPRKQGG